MHVLMNDIYDFIKWIHKKTIRQYVETSQKRNFYKDTSLESCSTITSHVSKVQCSD